MNAAHYVVAEHVVLRCRCGVEVIADSEERAERLMGEHLFEHKEEPPA
jgi:hypothetical protein